MPSDSTKMLTPVLVDATDAATIVGMSRTFFREQAELGFIGPRSYRFGRSGKKRLWSVEELHLWVRLGCVGRKEFQDYLSEQRKLEKSPS